jgi:hypothetical protein
LYQWEGGGGGERGRRVNMVQILCIHVCINAKIIPVETIPGMGRGAKESEGRCSENIILCQAY